MEIDVVYLTALIQDCRDPIGVLQRSHLPGNCEDEQGARNSLMKHFEKPLNYEQDTHAEHLAAMRYLGVDVPAEDSVSVVAFKQMNPSWGR